jgi:hypothetical protein
MQRISLYVCYNQLIVYYYLILSAVTDCCVTCITLLPLLYNTLSPHRVYVGPNDSASRQSDGAGRQPQPQPRQPHLGLPASGEHHWQSCLQVLACVACGGHRELERQGTLQNSVADRAAASASASHTRIGLLQIDTDTCAVRNTRNIEDFPITDLAQQNSYIVLESRYEFLCLSVL